MKGPGVWDSRSSSFRRRAGDSAPYLDTLKREHRTLAGRGTLPDTLKREHRAVALLGGWWEASSVFGHGNVPVGAACGGFGAAWCRMGVRGRNVACVSRGKSAPYGS